jgi:hypothetical protein
MRAFCSEQLKRKKKENGREDLKYGGSLLIQYDGDDGLGLEGKGCGRNPYAMLNAPALLVGFHYWPHYVNSWLVLVAHPRMLLRIKY